MGMRKYGQRDGEVTGVEQQGLSREAAGTGWAGGDDQDLAEENAAADGGSDG